MESKHEMKLSTPLCPECGRVAAGTVDTVPGLSEFSEVSEDGDTCYSGYTRMWHEEQRSDETPEGTLVACEEGHEWRSEITWYDR